MEGPKPQHLEYAAAPSPTSRFIYRAVLLLFGIFVIVGIVRVAPISWRIVKLKHIQQDALDYVAASEQEIYTSHTGASVRASQWDTLYSGMGLSEPPMATAFLHERTSGSGNRRLVAVGIARFNPPSSMGTAVVLLSRSIRPGTATSVPLEQRTSVLNFESDSPLTVYAGQPDPADASHFTIRMVNHAGEIILDGWLRDDDTVLIEPRPIRPAPSTATAGP